MGRALEIDRTLGGPDRDWVCESARKIAADFNRSSDTHLIKLDLPCLGGIDLYLKDESTHPTGSLKHRLARSLILYGLCNGWIRNHTPLIESSSGSTTISEAYFARLLGLPFIAVVPRTTSAEKIAQIEFYGGECHRVEPKQIYDEARRLADRLKGHYLDQFTFAERATDWRGNNNIAESMFTQLERERFPVPRWVVVSAGTGGTSSTSGVISATAPRFSAPRSSASSTRRTRSSSISSAAAIAASRPIGARASKASDGRGSSRLSSPASSTA
jgi:cysteine synthase